VLDGLGRTVRPDGHGNVVGVALIDRVPTVLREHRRGCGAADEVMPLMQ
jgi:hypothetical protein